MIKDYWKQERIRAIDKALLKPELTKREREALGRIDPTFLGGEFLPAYKPREVEIARLELASTTSDVVSVRARPGRGGILLRVVDEYGTRFNLPQVTSQRPLSLAELITFIEGTAHPELGQLPLCFNELNAQDGCRKDWERFTGISSDFYPQLGKHFKRVFVNWVREEPL